MRRELKYVFGPVPSRRLGRSLGVSPIPPKSCNYSCVYCQIGRTTHFTNTRKSFFPKEEILEEIITTSNEVEFDYLTFVGEGEPTLSIDLGWLINESKKKIKQPIAVITNGALLYNDELRRELKNADVILPTLDATEQILFKKINRPMKELQILKIIEGMKKFREIFEGEIWMEIMLVEGLNDTDESIDAIQNVLHELECERIYVNVPIRPPAEKWVKIPTQEKILEICKKLGAYNITHYESTNGFHLNQNSDIEAQILKITTRHPLRERQILEMIELPKENIMELLQKMKSDGLIRKIIHNEEAFWINAQSSIKQRNDT